MKKFTTGIFDEYSQLAKDVRQEFGRSVIIRAALNALEKRLAGLTANRSMAAGKSAVIPLAEADREALQQLARIIKDKMVEAAAAKLGRADARTPNPVSQINVLQKIAQTNQVQSKLIGRWIFFWRL